jgi:hypothetical protein
MEKVDESYRQEHRHIATPDGTGVVILMQNGEIIAQASIKLRPAETRYSATDREHLSPLLAGHKFRPSLYRQEARTDVYNDYPRLTWSTTS